MLELIRSRSALDALDHGYGPVVARDASDHSAQSAPSVERRRRKIDMDTQRGAAHFRKVKAVSRRSPGDARCQRGGPALEIRSCAANRIRIDHHAGVAEGNVFITRRSLNGLIIDAGIGHGDAEL